MFPGNLRPFTWIWSYLRMLSALRSSARSTGSSPTEREIHPPPFFHRSRTFLELRFGRGRVRVGGVEMVCWEREVIEHLKGGLRARVVYTVSGGKLSLIDVEDRDGAR